MIEAGTGTGDEGREINPRQPLPLSDEEKLRLEQLNLARLDEDLATGRFEFQSRPRIVEMQLSNFCNMSCIMCYDGENPKTLKLPEDVVDRVAAELFPTASIFVPFSTSEPLILTWDHTKRLAEQYNLELEITTNVQFLDEKKFAELAPHVAVLTFSIDSHYPDVFEHIRLKSKPDKVFANLPVAAKLCRDAGIEVFCNVVLMTENAPFLDRTVEYLADIGIPSIHIQRLLYNRPERAFSDPCLHMSQEWLEWMREKCRAVAREKEIKLFLEFGDCEIHDHRPEALKAGYRRSRIRDTWDWLDQLKLRHPGYCPQSVNRVRIDNEGNVYPCCAGQGEELLLGNVNESPIEDIWNGPDSQDIRRGMLTQDLPAHCVSCAFRTLPVPPVMHTLPFMAEHLQGAPDQRHLVAEAPEHLQRSEHPVTFVWKHGPKAMDHYEIVVSAGGQKVDAVVGVPGDVTEYTPPAEVWQQLEPNVGYWWAVFGYVAGAPELTMMSETAACFIRHQAIPRIEGSRIRYLEAEAPAGNWAGASSGFRSSMA